MQWIDEPATFHGQNDTIIIIKSILLLFNERHHSTFDSKPKSVIAEAIIIVCF